MSVLPPARPFDGSSRANHQECPISACLAAGWKRAGNQVSFDRIVRPFVWLVPLAAGLVLAYGCLNPQPTAPARDDDDSGSNGAAATTGVADGASATTGLNGSAAATGGNQDGSGGTAPEDPGAGLAGAGGADSPDGPGGAAGETGQ